MGMLASRLPYVFFVYCPFVLKGSISGLIISVPDHRFDLTVIDQYNVFSKFVVFFTSARVISFRLAVNDFIQAINLTKLEKKMKKKVRKTKSETKFLVCLK